MNRARTNRSIRIGWNDERDTAVDWIQLNRLRFVELSERRDQLTIDGWQAHFIDETPRIYTTVNRSRFDAAFNAVDVDWAVHHLDRLENGFARNS